MNCRTPERRREIVRDYIVTPEAHIQLLAGQTKCSDAGGIIENDYYLFDVKGRNNNFRDVIQCGRAAGRDFLELLNHPEVPLFNPLHVENGHGGGGGQVAGERDRWHPMAEQLYNAIMWTITVIEAQPGDPIFDRRAEAMKYKHCAPYASRIRAVNTTIRKCLHGSTLTERINEMRPDNNLRDELCQFNLLVEALANERDRDGNLLNTQSYF